MLRSAPLAALLVLAAGAVTAQAQSNVPGSLPKPTQVIPKAEPATDAQGAITAARTALTKLKWIGYDAKVEGQGITGDLTANVALEKAEAGGWKIAVRGELKGKNSAKGRPIVLGYDGVNAQSIRDADKQVAMLTGPASVSDLTNFFSKERAGSFVTWPTIDATAYEFKDAELKLEPMIEIDGERCNVVRVTVSKEKASDNVEPVSGVYYFSIKDGLLRKIERLRANAKPGDKPLRTVTFTGVKGETTLKGGEFALKRPDGYTVKAEKATSAPSAAPDKPQQVKAKAPAKIAVGEIAPEYSIKDPAGNEVSTKAYEGKVVVLDFWGVWCGWCVKAMPQIQKVHEKYKDKGVVVVGVNCREPSKNDPEKFMRDNKYTYTLGLKGDSVAQAFQVSGYPMLVIIGKDGKIALLHGGYDDNLEGILSNEIDKQLK